MKRLLLAAMLLMPTAALADGEISCVSSAWNLIGPDHKICVSSISDPGVPGVTCHLSHAKTGGVAGFFGLAEDKARFSIAYRQTGPINTDLSKLTQNEEVFRQKTSVFFKKTKLYRMVDMTNNTLVYLAMSDRLIDGSPENSISSVPIMPWSAK